MKELNNGLGKGLRALIPELQGSDIKINKELKREKGRPKLHEDGKFVRKTFIITPELYKALKLKSVNENIGINELVRQTLTKAIEDKYFQDI